MDTIVIGGMGGSGTRLVAQAVNLLGAPLGHDLNRALDDLTFTWLLKRPNRFAGTGSIETSGVEGALQAHETLNRYGTEMLVDPAGTLRTYVRTGLASYDQLLRAPYFGPRWVLGRIAAGFKYGGALGPGLWCFKEPHTTMFLPELAARYGERMAYVHLLRDGLDMALSDNTQQLRHWGESYGVCGGRPSPEQMFEFWFRFNRKALADMKDRLPGRAAVIDYDSIVAAPRASFVHLADFLGLDGSKAPEAASLTVGTERSVSKRGKSLSWRNEGVVREKLEHVSTLTRGLYHIALS